MSGTGHRQLRGTQLLRLQKEIQSLQKGGMSIPEITSTLKLAKGITLRHLYGNGEQRLIHQIIEETTIDTLLILAEGMETVKLEVQSMKVKAAMGQLNMTPEQLGTFLRGMEKATDLVKLMSGRGVAMFKDQAAEEQDPRLRLAQARLKELQGTAVNGKPIIEEAEEVHADD